MRRPLAVNTPTGNLHLNNAFSFLVLASMVGCARVGGGANAGPGLETEDLCGLVDTASGSVVVDLAAVRSLSKEPVEPASIGRKLWWRPTRYSDYRMLVGQHSGFASLLFPVSGGQDIIWFGSSTITEAAALSRAVKLSKKDDSSLETNAPVLNVFFSSMAGESVYCLSDGRISLLKAKEIRAPAARCVSVPFVLQPEEFISYGSSPVGNEGGGDRASLAGSEGVISFGPGTPFLWEHYEAYQPEVAVACGRL